LYLVQSGNEYKLVQQPVAAFNSLRQEVFSLAAQTVDTAYNLSFKGDVYDMELTIEPKDAAEAGIKILVSKGEETVIGYDKGTQQLYFDRTKSGNTSFNKKFASVDKAPVALKDGKLKLRVLVDRCVAEVFINNGETVLTNLVFPVGDDGGIQLFSKGGKAFFSAIKVYKIKM
jgi:fructan beta-fructosidase